MLSLTAKPVFRSTGLRFLVVAVVLFLGVTQFALSSERWQIIQRKPKVTTTNNSQHPLCSNLTGFDRIAITVRTGATEAAEKVPVQLRTSLRCVPVENILWFSDMNQDVGSHKLHDALDTIEPSVRDGNSDFDIYRKQQELQDPILIASQLRTMKDPSDSENLAAWKLDKYKNIHIVEKSWALKPNMDWYFNIDADTYVVWSSLLSWLPNLNSAKKSFIGAKTYDSGHAFAHGGSGLLLSKAASRDLAVVYNGTAARWDSKMDKIRYGDALLALALQEYGIPVTNSFPMFNGETPSTLWFHPGVWCMPIVTLHHISTPESEQMKAFEEKRPDQNAPLLYSELFKGMVFDMIPDHNLEDWDNRSEGEIVPDIASAEDCTLACAKQPDCMQTLYKENICTLGKLEEIVFGRKHEVEDGETKWRSSWNKTRIADWGSRQSKCEKLTWPKP
ncbi:hypothetical protein ONS95_001885 [Cadophora gregata]|uniref:uncharacterized protein n=1 Tax=Cadophora gregata TaxID=51156 RepID=UPI0026DB348D|nr:uncharacterized protein ONS95_001885 [Cadophora gregata]KAK0111531.1 hypothetical protein ONS95_001885 [Cadophora gregata]